MSRLNDQNASAATDMVAALETLKGCPADAGHFLIKSGFSPDQAAADFVESYAGVPATPRGGTEPAVLYQQRNQPDLLFGLYGCERRIRGWLPALAGCRMTKTAPSLAPVSPIHVKSDHQRWDQIDLGGLPFPQITTRDAGPYITMGFVMAGEAGQNLALSAHRMLVLGPDLLGISMLTSRHLRHMAQRAGEQGESLPISINIGVPPAVAIASATGTAHLPSRLDKLSLAGALAKAPIAISQGPDDGAFYLSRSAIVLHGELLADTTTEAIAPAPPGVTMPEFLGYDGHAGAPLQLIKLNSISQRPNAMMQAVVGPGREQSAILGLGGALSLALGLDEGLLAENAFDLRFSYAGGGMLLLFVALKDGHTTPLEPLARQMIDICPFVKTVVFVDQDVDLSSEEDMLWAMTTRANLAQDCHPVQGFAPMRMDPSQGDAWAKQKGYTPTRCYVDATVPPSCRSAASRSFV
ncbi:UbiD family decarboxylase [Litoreibacter janthinus]|uniref:4-hydroxy-3-polyprenylbenzoate decarboxylase n=1 Tax=Litoreibacter janthinus TaxID=670154 RepID=A0A1I6GDF0_9RHOB|nr:UbiD family decarboxylase [Litoreibacter janthinus]SFR40225.1 4-hydroxy-3-polyprenylbenzoate decarboxylase [Litoreibacter janthinus]